MSVRSVDRAVFTAPDVFAKFGDDVDQGIEIFGALRIAERADGIYIEWQPAVEDPSNLSPSTPSSCEAHNGWVVEPEPPRQPPQSSAAGPLLAAAVRSAFAINTEDIRSFYCDESTKNGNVPNIQFIGKDGTRYQTLYLQNVSRVPKFIEKLQCYVSLKRSAKEKNLVLLVDERREALHQSVNALFEKDDRSKDFFSRLVTNPYATAMTTLGKVAGVLQPTEVNRAFLDDGVDAEEQRVMMQSLIERERLESAFYNVDDQPDATGTSRSDENGFELVTRLDLPPRPKISREEPVKHEQLVTFTTADGSYDVHRGLEPEIRKDVWKYLLGYFEWAMLPLELTAVRNERADEYFRIKMQWKTISSDQESRFSRYRDFKSLVDKDVHRTDRTHPYFQGDGNPHLTEMNDILMTYVMYNFDLGYVQGMSDYLAPILYVMQDEVDAFWCFVGLMDRIHENFAMEQRHIRAELMSLRDLLMVVNPRLANYLESHDSDNMYFTFRWLLVHFKREFSFNNILRLWEVLWTALPCKNFHLLVCIAVLDRQCQVIIENKFGLNAILKHINDLALKIPLDETLCSAEAIYHQLAATQHKLPKHVCDVLGLDGAD